MEDKREDQAEEFAYRFGQSYGARISPENKDLLSLRLDLISEEFLELSEAAQRLRFESLEYDLEPSSEQVEHLLKELADLQYVLSGFAVAFSLPLTKAVDEIHESNMTKIGDDGKAKFDSRGKVMKGPHYRPADMRRVLEDYSFYQYEKEIE